MSQPEWIFFLDTHDFWFQARGVCGPSCSRNLANVTMHNHYRTTSIHHPYILCPFSNHTHRPSQLNARVAWTHNIHGQTQTSGTSIRCQSVHNILRLTYPGMSLHHAFPWSPMLSPLVTWLHSCSPRWLKFLGLPQIFPLVTWVHSCSPKSLIPWNVPRATWVHSCGPRSLISWDVPGTSWNVPRATWVHSCSPKSLISWNVPGPS